MSSSRCCPKCNYEFPKRKVGRPQLNPERLVTAQECSACYYIVNKEQLKEKCKEKYLQKKLEAACTLVAQHDHT